MSRLHDWSFQVRAKKIRDSIGQIDRALRDMVVALGGAGNGFPRQTGFDITVASEVMAILCLSNDLEDLQKRLGDIVVAYTRAKTPIYARDILHTGPVGLGLLRGAPAVGALVMSLAVARWPGPWWRLRSSWMTSIPLPAWPTPKSSPPRGARPCLTRSAHGRCAAASLKPASRRSTA